MEVAFAIFIMGLGIGAMLQLVGSVTQANRALNEYCIATTLARTGQEWVGTRKKTQLLAFFGTATEKQADEILDAGGEAIANSTYSGYSQVFSYRKVSDADPSATDADGRLYEVTVAVRRGTATLCTLTRLHDLS